MGHLVCKCIFHDVFNMHDREHNTVLQLDATLNENLLKFDVHAKEHFHPSLKSIFRIMVPIIIFYSVRSKIHLHVFYSKCHVSI